MSNKEDLEQLESILNAGEEQADDLRKFAEDQHNAFLNDDNQQEIKDFAVANKATCTIDNPEGRTAPFDVSVRDLDVSEISAMLGNNYEDHKPLNVTVSGSTLPEPIMQTEVSDGEEALAEEAANDKEALHDLIGRWQGAVQRVAEIKRLVGEEMALRKEVFALAFPAPNEGVNDYPLDNDYVLKGTYKLDRKIEESTFIAIREKLTEVGVNPDDLVKQEPKLVTKTYKALAALPISEGMENVGLNLFEQCLTTKPGSPTLVIKAPKASKA